MSSRKSILILLAFPHFAASAAAQVTTRASVSPGGVEANGASSRASISADGRYIAFQSAASDLVPGDTNGVTDVFVRDRWSDTVERVSVSSGAAQADYHCLQPRITPDGRFVVFDSWSSNLVPPLNTPNGGVFVHDRLNGTTELASVSSAGVPGTGLSDSACVSADGRFVSFASSAANLVAGDTNSKIDVFLHDRLNGTTERMSVNSAGVQGNDQSWIASLSDDGNLVAFTSVATNLVGGDSNFQPDIFVRDRQAGTTQRVSVSSAGVQGNFDSTMSAITPDGRYVVFDSGNDDLDVNDNNFQMDIFVRDRQLGTTELVSLGAAGQQGNATSQWPWISPDGRFITFQSSATNLVPGDSNGVDDVFLRDRLLGTTERVSVSTAGVQGNAKSQAPPLTPEGRFVAFESWASDLVAGDGNAATDIFVRDRDATGFASLCHPGQAGVIACPCANPPAGSSSGCDNFSATGGAELSASGFAYLAQDTLVFTTYGQNPTATSVLIQGNGLIAAGIAFGHGVRCVGGPIKRLYLRAAVGGSIEAPSPGDPTVSARSAQLGDPIQPGETRWYLVYYRDPLVSGGCPPASAFNATQTASIAWWP